jgi:hypothetical protein
MSPEVADGLHRSFVGIKFAVVHFCGFQGLKIFDRAPCLPTKVAKGITRKSEQA